MAAKVLSVGSCASDDYRMARLLQTVGADLRTAGTLQEALELAGREQFDLVLVNRINDWDGTRGVDFIAAARKAGTRTPMMLVSDYEEAQAEAVAAGALPGFGKSQMRDAAVSDLLRRAIVAG